MSRPHIPIYLRKNKLLTFRIRSNEDAKRLRYIINKMLEKERKKHERNYI